MYKRNGCFSLVWVYFISFHLFRNAQVVGSSPTISSKTCVKHGVFAGFFFFRKEFQNSTCNKNLTLFYGVRFCSFI